MRKHEHRRDPRAAAKVGKPRTSVEPTGPHQQVLRLQQLAGNAAVTELLTPDRLVPRDAGRPLNLALRREMGARLGQDLSSVRLHEDANATHALGAHAYTVGADIVFAPGKYDERRLAHELVHVVQQARGPVEGTEVAPGIAVSDPADRHEREADAATDRLLRGEYASPVDLSAPQGGWASIQCYDDEGAKDGLRWTHGNATVPASPAQSPPRQSRQCTPVWTTRKRPWWFTEDADWCEEAQVGGDEPIGHVRSRGVSGVPGGFMPRGRVVGFEYGKSSLLSDAKSKLQKLAKHLQEYVNHDATILVKGYASRPGSRKFNAKLSQNRADVVRSYLVELGIDSAKIAATGFGEEKAEERGYPESRDLRYDRVVVVSVVSKPEASEPEPAVELSVDVGEPPDSSAKELGDSLIEGLPLYDMLEKIKSGEIEVKDLKDAYRLARQLSKLGKKFREAAVRIAGAYAGLFVRVLSSPDDYNRAIGYTYGLMYAALDMGEVPRPTNVGSAFDEISYREAVQAARDKISDDPKKPLKRHLLLAIAEGQGSEEGKKRALLNEIWNQVCSKSLSDFGPAMCLPQPWPKPRGIGESVSEVHDEYKRAAKKVEDMYRRGVRP